MHQKNVLILGGTQFVGRHIAEEMLAAGHRVSILNRGKTPDALPPTVERLRGDRNDGAAGLQSLAYRTWDACIDVSGLTPRQVRPSAELLRENIGRYIFVSAVSVYGDPRQAPVTEACPRLPPASENITEVNCETYGPLKVACENIVQQTFGERCALLRPQIVAGPYDPIDRFSYWTRRSAQPGEMLAPGDGLDHLQVIDARDLARFVVATIENGLSGSFNLAGPRLTWTEFVKLLGVQNVVWVPVSILKSAGVTEFELPLFRPDGGARSSLMHVCNERAFRAGLILSAPELTISDTRNWLKSSDLHPALSPALEAKLIKMSRVGANRANRQIP